MCYRVLKKQKVTTYINVVTIFKIDMVRSTCLLSEVSVIQLFDLNLITKTIILSGAHTIGVSHCSTISTRLYNFTGKGDQDPDLDNEYAKNLKTFKCKNINDQTTLIEMDPGSRNTFDLGFFKQVVKRRGLFQSDAALLKSSTTRSILAQHLQSNEKFFIEFGRSMEKMGRINVKIGTEGEIRKHCAFIN